MEGSVVAAAVKPERILKDLAKLWIDLSKEDRDKGSAGVLRACAMTLIAAVEEESDAQAVSETIGEIMHQHPSRTIVMKVLPDTAEGLEARVFAQCWMPFGRRQQICCEQIEITASKLRVADLPKLVLALMVPDLPVVLWSKSEGLSRDLGFQQLFALADKIIVDSATFAGPALAFEFIRDLLAKGYNVADLTWTRLTRLREIIAQIFDNELLLPKLHQLQRVIISYSGPAAVEPGQSPTCLQYLVTWFQTTLPLTVETVFRQSQPHYEILGISLDGPDLQVSVELENAAASIYVNGLSRRMSFPKLNDCDLMREELSILGEDRIYRRCVA